MEINDEKIRLIHQKDLSEGYAETLDYAGLRGPMEGERKTPTYPD